MKNPASQGKRDANQRDLVCAFEKMGCTVLDLGSVGKGCPDLLVSIQGGNYLVECKTRQGKLLKSQRKFAERWNAEVFCVRDRWEVIKLVNGWRSQ